MSLVLFAQNLLEASASIVTVAPAAVSTKPITRIYDRDKGPQYEGGSAAQTDIDIDLGSAVAVTGWALVNHNITGVTVTLFGDSISPPTTSRDSFSAAGADVLRTFASLSLRYWRIRIPVMASAPKIGEAMLGVPRIITLNPFFRDAGEATLGNVTRERSPGGYSWAAKKGAKRIRLAYRWRTLSDAEVATLEAAFDEVNQGAKKLMMQDAEIILHWIDWITAIVAPIPAGGGLNEVEAVFEESL